MKLRWIPCWVVALGALAVPACSRDEPSAPRLHSISGHLRLTGYLVDGDGRFAGTKVVGNAGGVPVELVYGDRIVAQTTTVDGVFGFAGLGPGGYVARTHVIGNIGDETEPLTISASDIAAADTLRLVSQGDLYPVPNPIGESATIYFDLPDTEFVEINILDLAGHTVRGLRAREIPAGFNAVVWNGLDQAGRPATAPMYWVTLVSGEDIRAQLLFR